jgi:uroporphyrinogen III methyltransferase/synthase
VVVHDRLVDGRLVERARRDAEVIDAGKAAGERGSRQARINALLIERAREGKCVIRLKGGDPFLFGRGGEEAEALAEAGIPFEVVPGVTSALAVPAYAGIPLTQRGHASSLTIVTGSESLEERRPIAWDKLAQAGGTLVVLMGWDNLSVITETLLREGRAASTPVAVVQWGTEPYQRTVVGDLSNIVPRSRGAGLAPPVVMVVGEVVSLRDRLRWFDDRPLFGKRVLVTRTMQQAGALSTLLSREGAHPLEAPTIEVQPLDTHQALDRELDSLAEYGWVVFGSANAAETVFGRLASMGRDARSLYGVRVAAMGSATAVSLASRGIVADLVASGSGAESMVDALKGADVAGGRILLLGAESRRDTLTEGLRAAGAAVDQIAAYRTVTPEGSRARLAEVLSEGIDVATFTSSSTMRNMAALVDGDLAALEGVKIACIGPVTAEAAREAGLKVDVLARESTVAGLVDALKSYYVEEAASNE